jgi:UDP-3-O-[3-hydroxymyristoyl] glucosamine N-acyltransferase
MIILIGKGGHSRQIQDVLIQQKKEFKAIEEKDLKNYVKEKEKYEFHIAIGDNAIRKRIYEENKELNWCSVISDNANISPSAKLGIGNYVGVNAYVGNNCKVGNFNILNEFSKLIHDCKIEDYNHISIGATILARSSIGSLNTFYTNAVCFPDLQVGSQNVIGATTKVLKSVTSGHKIIDKK